MKKKNTLHQQTVILGPKVTSCGIKRLKVIVIIPVRMASTRLPGATIKSGKTILEWTFIQTKKAINPRNIYIATDSKEIIDEWESRIRCNYI